MSKAKQIINMWEMSNFRPAETGLPMVLWIQPKSGKERHGPRIKIQAHPGDKVDPENFISVTISDFPEPIGKGSLVFSIPSQTWKQVVKFIHLNKEGLLKVWNDEITPFEFASKYLKKV